MTLKAIDLTNEYRAYEQYNFERYYVTCRLSSMILVHLLRLYKIFIYFENDLKEDVQSTIYDIL